MAFFSRGIHKTQGSIQANYADETKRGKELEGIIQGIRRDSDQREAKYTNLLQQSQQHAAQLAAAYQQKPTMSIAASRPRNENGTFAQTPYSNNNNVGTVRQPQQRQQQQQQPQQANNNYTVNKRTTGGRRVQFQQPIINNASTLGQNQHRRGKKINAQPQPAVRKKSQICIDKQQRRLRKQQQDNNGDNVDGGDFDDHQHLNDGEYSTDEDNYYYSSEEEDSGWL